MRHAGDLDYPRFVDTVAAQKLRHEGITQLRYGRP